MRSQRKEIRDDDDLIRALLHQSIDGARQQRIPEFQEGWLHRVAACLGELPGRDSYRFVGAFHARAMSEQDKCGHNSTSCERGRSTVWSGSPSLPNSVTKKEMKARPFNRPLS